MAVPDTLEVVRAAIARVEQNAANLARTLQDHDAELAACDDPKECATIAARRMEASFELATMESTLRGVVGALALIAGGEQQTHSLRRVA